MLPRTYRFLFSGVPTRATYPLNRFYHLFLGVQYHVHRIQRFTLRKPRPVPFVPNSAASGVVLGEGGGLILLVECTGLSASGHVDAEDADDSVTEAACWRRPMDGAGSHAPAVMADRLVGLVGHLC